jgi:hypothetical protein
MVLLKRPNARCSWSRTFECWIVRDGATELGRGIYSHDAWAAARRKV